ncbi:DUF982 domain-containing protein [Rhizobium beringeri]
MSERWPRQLNDPTWQHARASCLRSLQGELQPTRARQAFVSAARAAHLKVLPDDEQRLGAVPSLRAERSSCEDANW